MNIPTAPNSSRDQFKKVTDQFVWGISFEKHSKGSRYLFPFVPWRKFYHKLYIHINHGKYLTYYWGKCIVRKFNTLIKLTNLLFKKLNTMIKATDLILTNSSLWLKEWTQFWKNYRFDNSNSPNFEKFNATMKLIDLI